MGVSGLSSFLKQRARPEPRRWQVSSLAAATNLDNDGTSGPRIVLDGWAAVHHQVQQLEHFESRKSRSSNSISPALDVALGRLNKLLDSFAAFIEDLSRVSRGHLLVVFDGSLPKSKQQTRFERDSGKLRTVREAVAGRVSSAVGGVLPPLLLDRVIGRLAQLGLEWIPIIDADPLMRPRGGVCFAMEEADLAAAWLADFYWPTSPNSPSDSLVLSNDTDFLCFYPSRYLYAPLDLITLRATSSSTSDSVELSASVYPPGALANLLGFPPVHLPLLAGLVGNDFTGHFSATIDIPDAVEAKSAASSHRRILDAASLLKSAGKHATMERVLEQINEHNGSRLESDIVEAMNLSCASYRLPDPSCPPISNQTPKVTELLASHAFYCTPALEDQTQPCCWEPSGKLRRAAYGVLGLGQVTEYLRHGTGMVNEVVGSMPVPTTTSRGGAEAAEVVFRKTLAEEAASTTSLPTLLAVSFARTMQDLGRLGNHELLALLCSLLISSSDFSSPSSASDVSNKRSIHVSACFQTFLASCALLSRALGHEKQARQISDWDSTVFFATVGRARGGAGIESLVTDAASASAVRAAYDEAMKLLGPDSVDIIFDYSLTSAASIDKSSKKLRSAVSKKPASKSGKKGVNGVGEISAKQVSQANVFEALAGMDTS